MSLAPMLEVRPGPVVVLSPHLDDAVLSMGAAMAHASRGGESVRVVTVFANDPASRAPAGAWDAACGFTTQGAAARARREEDRRACAALGVEPVWLPFADGEHDSSADDADVEAAVLEHLRDAGSVFVPGAPLAQPDHAWLTELVVSSPAIRIPTGFYVEQPYAALTVMSRGGRLGSEGLTARRGALNAMRIAARCGREIQEPGRARVPGGRSAGAVEWCRLAATARDRRAKRRAIAAYASQLCGFGPLVRTRMALHERGWGGEGGAWCVIDRAPGPERQAT